jgi:hypothetical protein
VPIQGFIRFRRHQVGKETNFSSNTPATRRLPFRGPIVVEPNRTTPDVDTGSLDPWLPAFAGATDVTGTWDGKQAINDMPWIYGLGLKGGVTATGGPAYTYTFQAASLTADSFDYVTDEWSDDVSSDSIVAAGGVINSWTETFGEDLSAWDISAELYYAKATYGAGLTSGLSVDETPEWAYGAHTVIYMDSNPAAIGITPLLDAVHGATYAVNNNLDRKRYAEGSNSGWILQGYGRGPRELEFTVRLAKTTASVAEAQTLDDTPVPTRYFDVKTTSTELVSGTATPHSVSRRFAAELIGRSDSEIGGNSVIELRYRGRYDSTLGYALRNVVVCSSNAFG